MQDSKGKGKGAYEVRVVATNGKSTWDLCWIKARSTEVQCGLSARGYRHHSSFHQSGEIRISKERSSSLVGDEVPAAAQVGTVTPRERIPLEQLTNAERITDFVLPIDEDSLQDYPLFTKKQNHDSVVYIDARSFPKNLAAISVWVAPRDYFFERIPEPPGFRYILAPPQLWHTGQHYPQKWLIIEVHDG